jgi:hypothetical protein
LAWWRTNCSREINDIVFVGNNWRVEELFKFGKQEWGWLEDEDEVLQGLHDVVMVLKVVEINDCNGLVIFLSRWC